MDKMKKWLILGTVCSVSVVAGLVVPLILGDDSAKASPTATEAMGEEGDKTTAEDKSGDDKHGKDAGKGKDDKKKDDKKGAHGGAAAAGGHGGGHGGAAHEGGPTFVPAWRAVVNLNENTLVYLSIEITLETEAADEAQLKRVLERRKPILKSWLIGYLSDKTVEDVRGRGGFNRLRRDILENFNNLLFPDGSEKVKDIHFEEFQIQ